MASREALLIGIARYGDGFQPLPEVALDLQHIEAALAACGFEVTHCPAAELASASALDRRVREFCRSGGTGDIRLVYFSGHGLRVEGADWIVPEGVSRVDAAQSPSQRVATDLSATVDGAAVGLVLFVIDACRDVAHAAPAKGSGGWGEPAGFERPAALPRFVRYYGCEAGQVCQVLPEAQGSLFTSALADCLKAPGNATLQALQAAVESRCAELLRGQPLLTAQRPHLSVGELNADTQRALLERRLFEPGGRGLGSGIWAAFDPQRLHLLVVVSEYGVNHEAEWGLWDLVEEALAGDTGDRIRAAFRAACDGAVLVDGRQRVLPASSGVALLKACFSVLDAFAGNDRLCEAVRAVVEADLVVFDVTGFEPGVMFLVGVRAAARRGLSLCSHGGGWREGQPLEPELPFNLQELNLNSHTESNVDAGESNPVVDRFVTRAVNGWRQMARQPHYQDLPGFEALRRMGADYDAAATIKGVDQVLVLCSFDKSFLKNWQFVQGNLKKALSKRGANPRIIGRIIDYGQAQLVLQALFEQLRRCAACVVDWSGFSASVFLELGARLAVSEWGAVQIIDERHLPGGIIEHRHKLGQIELMRRLLQPVVYAYRGSNAAAIFDDVAAVLVRPAGAERNRIHDTVVQAVGRVQTAVPPLAEDLVRQADSLHHRAQGTAQGKPQVLYADSIAVRSDAERAARELRVAAWLYLEHRVRATGRQADREARKKYEDLGRGAVDALYDLGDDASIALAEEIEARLAKRETPDPQN
ncbi:MAG: caspase family protein [Burkholderiaceae bacterium]|jgi:hypothetical protein|nr:caspase family protein [Burkholderiaceae bacterium]